MSERTVPTHLRRLESLAAELEATGNYRVLRRLGETPLHPLAVGEEPKTAVFVDCETTGLDRTGDEIIELAMVPFEFMADGRIVGIGAPWRSLRQPAAPIPPEISAITGIDDDMVLGCAIDPDEVAAFIEPAVLIVAHHAAFDRPFIEKLCPAFATKAWACSMEQIDWKAEGMESKRLGSLATDFGFFYDAHRATDDCLAAIDILARTLPTGAMALAKLLAAARETTTRIAAVNAPFAMKDTLKARGYRWSDGSDGRVKAWQIDVPETKSAEEIAWLHSDIYGSTIDLPTQRITAFSRFKEFR